MRPSICLFNRWNYMRKIPLLREIDSKALHSYAGAYSSSGESSRVLTCQCSQNVRFYSLNDVKLVYISLRGHFRFLVSFHVFLVILLPFAIFFSIFTCEMYLLVCTKNLANDLSCSVGEFSVVPWLSWRVRASWSKWENNIKIYSGSSNFTYVYYLSLAT